MLLNLWIDMLKSMRLQTSERAVYRRRVRICHAHASGILRELVGLFIDDGSLAAALSH
jgi:hypothetical protein